VAAEMWASVVGSLIQVVGGAIAGILLTLLAVRLQKPHKMIEYEVITIPLINRALQDTSLYLSVDKFLLTGNDSDRKLMTPVDKALAFEITLQNTGRDDVIDSHVEIKLDDTAKIVSYETHPTSRPGYTITAKRDDQEYNILRLSIPFINTRERVMLKIISVLNPTHECTIDILGPGVKSQRRGSNTVGPLAALGPSTLVALAIALLWLLSQEGAPLASSSLRSLSISVSVLAGIIMIVSLISALLKNAKR
jgi:hypothetical protein